MGIPLEDCTRPGVPLMRLYQGERVLFWPMSRLAMLRQEWDGRLEATDCDGQVAHRPGPLDDFRGRGLHEVHGGVLVNPAYVRRDGPALSLPGGWTLREAPLPPPAPALEPDPEAVLAVLRHDGGYTWLTLQGERPGPPSRPAALQEFPDLVRFGYHLVRPGAIREVTRTGQKICVTLEGGRTLQAGVAALEALGFAGPDLLHEVPAGHRKVYELGLRDWPSPLLLQEDHELRRRYAGRPERLVDDVLWEAFRTGGRRTTVRGLYYNPLIVLADRVGVKGFRPSASRWDVVRLLQASLPRLQAAGRWDSDRFWLELQLRLEQFVGDWRLFTYGSLGIVDEGAADRRLGAARPHVILVVEKGSLKAGALRLAETFGLSLLVLGGVPGLMATEFFVDFLRPATAGPVHLLSYCDYDPYGWYFPDILARHLSRYGVETARIARLVTPAVFTAEERRRLAVDLPRDPNSRARVEAWVGETGGVDGLPLGLYADFVPLERLEEAIRRETALP